jgi:hypothetical protein
MSSSEALLASGPLGRSACYPRAADAHARTGRPPAVCPPGPGDPVAAAPLIPDPRAGAETHPNLPGLADGFPLTALDAVGARLHALRTSALRARLRGRTDP